MKTSGLNKSYQLSGTDISLLIIATFCLFVVAIIGYRCCLRKRSARKKKAAQRRIPKRGNHHESGELLNTASQSSDDVLDPEDQDTITNSTFEKKPADNKKYKKHSTREKKPSSENQNTSQRSVKPSILSSVMSNMSRKGGTGVRKSSNTSNSQAASSSKQGSSDTKRVKKQENGGSHDPESKKKAEVRDRSKAEDRKDSSVGRGRSNSNHTTSVRIPTNDDPLRKSRAQKAESAQLLGIHHSYGGDKGKKQQLRKGDTACNSSSSSCKMCTVFNHDLNAFKDSEREDMFKKRKKEENQAIQGFRGGQVQKSSTTGHKPQKSLDDSDSEPEFNGHHGQGDIATNAEEDSAMDIRRPPGFSSDVHMRDATEEYSNEWRAKALKDEPRVTRTEESLEPHLDNEMIKASLEPLLDKVVTEERKSIGDEYNLMQYARNEWKSDTETARAVREGYFQIPVQLGLNNLRVIRGDNYCAIRAALFQVLVKKIPILSSPEDHIDQIPQRLLSEGCDWIDEWTFGSRLEVEKDKVCDELEVCLKELNNLVDLTAQMGAEQGRASHLLSHFNFQPIETEIRLLEAVKFLMLFRAIQLYDKMKKNEDVPMFAMIMFARDTCEDPWHFMAKHLNAVGDSGGLEQVEMHLLGYTLGVTMKVVRPSHFGQPDFIASYPDDMPEGTPFIAMVAEDDRHYNVLS